MHRFMDDDNAKNLALGRRIALARNAADLTQAELGVRLGYQGTGAKQMIHQLESGQLPKTWGRLVGLVETLGVSADWLFGHGPALPVPTPTIDVVGACRAWTVAALASVLFDQDIEREVGPATPRPKDAADRKEWESLERRRRDVTAVLAARYHAVSVSEQWLDAIRVLRRTGEYRRMIERHCPSALIEAVDALERKRLARHEGPPSLAGHDLP